MSRRPLPFIGSLFSQSTATALAPINSTALTETVPDRAAEISVESESILRRGNWDYMWRKVRDKAAQEHPEFAPDVEFEDDGSQTL